MREKQMFKFKFVKPADEEWISNSRWIGGSHQRQRWAT